MTCSFVLTHRRPDRHPRPQHAAPARGSERAAPQRTPAARGGGTRIAAGDRQRRARTHAPTFTLEASPSPTGLDLVLGETRLEAGPLASCSSSPFPRPRAGSEVTRDGAPGGVRPTKWGESVTRTRDHRAGRQSLPRALSALSPSALWHVVQTGHRLTLNQFTRSSTTSPPLPRKGVANPILTD